LAERLRNANERKWLSAIISKLTNVEIEVKDYYNTHCREAIEGFKLSLKENNPMVDNLDHLLLITNEIS